MTIPNLPPFYLPGYPVQPLPDVVPFTARSGATFAEVFYQYKNYIESELIPNINENQEKLVVALNEMAEGALTAGIEVSAPIMAAVAADENSVFGAILRTMFAGKSVESVLQDVAEDVDSLSLNVGQITSEINSRLSNASIDTRAKDASVIVSVPRVARNEIYATDFGVKANGAISVADLDANTVAFQNFVNAVQSQSVNGILPSGNININNTINIATLPNWSIEGAGRTLTTIVQHKDNVPIFNIGAIAGSLAHSFSIRNFGFQYINFQPATNTLAICVLLSTMVFENVFYGLKFANGHTAIKLANNVGGPWGSNWDELTFHSKLSYCAMDWTGVQNAVPNNKWGRFLVELDSMTGPYAFINLRGYNWEIGVLEFLQNKNGIGLFHASGALQCDISSIKVEVATYANPAAIHRGIFWENSGFLKIQAIDIGGSTPHEWKAAANMVFVDASSGGQAGGVDIGSIRASNFTTKTGTGITALISGRSNRKVSVGFIDIGSDWALTNNASGDGADHVQVRAWIAGRLSADMPDADLTIVEGDPNKIRFATPFTAPRVINLPALRNATNRNFAGLYFELIFDGAINGTNTATIRPSVGGPNLKVLTSDKCIIGFTWRRHASPASGWIVTKYETLPA